MSDETASAPPPARRSAGTGDRGGVVLVTLAVVALLFIVLPLVALLAQVRWGSLLDDLTTAGAREALWLSLRTTVTSALLAAFFGTPLAWWLSRLRGRAAVWTRAVVTVPLVLPPVVAGVALLDAWGRSGLLGRAVPAVTGEPVPYSWVRVVMAETFVAMPFFVLAAEGAFRGLDARWSRTAEVLGASRWFTLRHVLVPMTLPGLLAGLTLAWARAFGEFGATITFAGSYPGRTQTGPLAVYQALDISQDAATALAALMLALCVVLLALLRGHWVGAGGERR
jgi:molybdate transport system permease protein